MPGELSVILQDSFTQKGLKDD